MLKRMGSFIVIMACVILAGYSPVSQRYARQKEQVLSGAAVWPKELIAESFPVPESPPSCVKTSDNEIIIQFGIFSYEEYLNYLNRFEASGVGGNTFFEEYPPLSCTYFASCPDYTAIINYYSDVGKPACNMEIIIEIPEQETEDEA